jgi:hypothetical protein
VEKLVSVFVPLSMYVVLKARRLTRKFRQRLCSAYSKLSHTSSANELLDRFRWRDRKGQIVYARLRLAGVWNAAVRLSKETQSRLGIVSVRESGLARCTRKHRLAVVDQTEHLSELGKQGLQPLGLQVEPIQNAWSPDS